MKKTSVLAFDCACFGASIALSADGTTRTTQLTQGEQATGLVNAMDGLLKQAGVAYQDLDTIISTVGPGSFTGLRIGLAALHGLVLVNRTPIKLLSTLEAMAWQVARRPHAPSSFIVSIKAGKGELYAQEFTADDGEPSARGEIYFTPETKADWALPCYGNHLPEGDAHHLPGPDAATLCAIAPRLPVATLAEAMPLYIRPPDAAIPARPTWLA